MEACKHGFKCGNAITKIEWQDLGHYYNRKSRFGKKRNLIAGFGILWQKQIKIKARLGLWGMARVGIYGKMIGNVNRQIGFRQDGGGMYGIAR